jgi:nitrite reductase/ring-hydroxylating ferredoxin subunit
MPASGRQAYARRPGELMDEDGNFIACSEHNAQSDLDTGHCFTGRCQGARLTQLTLVVDDGDFCVTGVALAEEDGLDRLNPPSRRP